MRSSLLARLSYFGITAVLLHRRDPILGSIILTDRCNLSCKHCAVSNITGVIYPYTQVKSEMQMLLKQGVRILFFYGGEPLIWEDRGITLRDLVK
jgi:Fe-coproporphyrin III synthase